MTTKKYRHAVAALVLRPAEVCAPGGECKTVYSILLLHKPRKRDAWQLPQGGVEQGETIAQAAAREVQEEAGLVLGEPVCVSAAEYTYDFPAEFVARQQPVNCGQRLNFVAFLAEPGAKVTVDENEVDAHVWVLPEQLALYMDRAEYQKIVEGVLEECRGKLSNPA